MRPTGLAGYLESSFQNFFGKLDFLAIKSIQSLKPPCLCHSSVKQSSGSSTGGRLMGQADQIQGLYFVKGQSFHFLVQRCHRRSRSVGRIRSGNAGYLTVHWKALCLLPFQCCVGFLCVTVTQPVRNSSRASWLYLPAACKAVGSDVCPETSPGSYCDGIFPSLADVALGISANRQAQAEEGDSLPKASSNTLASQLSLLGWNTR